MAVKKWRGKWVVDLKIDGQRVRRVSPEQTRAGAKRYEAELLLGREDVVEVEPDDGPAAAALVCPTLAEFAPEWWGTYAVTHNKPSEQARKEIALRVHLVPFFGNWRLDAITPRLIDRFKGQRLAAGMKASTVNGLVAILRTLLHCAVDWGHLDRVPKIRLIGRVTFEFDWLQPAEAARLLTAAKTLNPKWYTFIFAALRTGLRKGELLGLHWRQIDLERRRLTVKYTAWRGRLGTPKSGRSRVVPMPGDLTEALRSWRLRSTGPVVFPNRKGGVITAMSAPNRALDRALERAALKRIRFHDLRHTYASHLVLERRSLREVQLLMGHHSITTTERYAHIADDQLVAAVDVLDGLGESEPEGP